MNDKIIAKTIPKIQNNLLLFLGALFFVGFLTFIALIEGVHIASLKIGDVKIEQLYLKWDHKFHIKASSIIIKESVEKEPVDLQKLSSLPKWIRIGRQWIDAITIDSIRYGDFAFSLKYDHSGNNEFGFVYKDIRCIHRFTLTPASLQMQTNEGSSFSNTLFMDLERQRFHGVFNITLPKTPDLTIRYRGNDEKLSFNASFNGIMQTLEPIGKFFNIDDDIIPWLTTAMTYDSLEIDSISGTIRYQKPETLLKSLKATGIFKNAHYQFDPAIAPIKAQNVIVTFENSKLWIRPIGGHFYSLPTQNSHLNIDFGSKNVMLNAFIKTDKAVLNDDILELLKHYEISVPVKQLDGTCNVDLNLSIDLHTNETHASGIFRPSASTLMLDALTLWTKGGIVSLNDSMVNFEEFNADYMGIADGRVKGYYNATSETGNVSIQIQHIRPIPDNSDFYLLSDQNPLQIEYQIAPKHDSLKVAPSRWHFMGEQLNVQAFTVPYHFRQGIMQIPRTKFAINKKISGQITGSINTLMHNANFDLLIDSIHLSPFELAQRPLSIQAKFDEDKIRFLTKNSSHWLINQLPFTISKVEATLDKNVLIFDNINFLSDNLFNGSVSSKFNISDNSGEITFNKIHYIESKLKPIIESDEHLSFDLIYKNNAIDLHSRALGTRFKTEQDGWRIEIDDISRISRHSPILKYYNIDKGHLNIFYGGPNTQYVFNGELVYPYKLMEVNNESFSKYRFFGTYKDGKSNIRINDRMVLSHDDVIRIKGRNIGINIPELTRFLNDHRAAEISSPSPSSQKLYIELKESHLYINKDHKILADMIHAVSAGDKFNATLEHRKGVAKLAMEKQNFYIDGNGFNEHFMKELFHYSDLIGGELSFQAKGTLENFEGNIRVQNTTLKKHQVLNNVLAFINTVPSLATFSLPNYDSKGLPLSEAYAHFSHRKSIITMDNVTMISPEVKIYGEGSANLASDTIKGTMTLKTDLGSKLSKVPMVGYILLGKDGSVSTTLTVKGKLSDPEVETAFAKEILSAPFNILKRTLIYPFLWMMEDEK